MPDGVSVQEKRVGIVVCNYNKRELVLQCIQALLEQRYKAYDLYVVDNGSTDGSAEAIREAYGDALTLIETGDNLGGSGGFNTGLRAAREHCYEYLMCVDNDALLDEGAVGALVDFLDGHHEAGLAASKIYHLEDPDYVQNYGQNIDFDRFCTEAYFYNEYEDGSMPPFVYSDAVPACSLMIRTSVTDEIGLLPETNYLYWDDTEWCYLCRLAGYRVASVGASVALHSMGAKKEYTTTFPTYYAIRNMISFFLRYTPEANLRRMCTSFLSDVYEEQYVGSYTGTYNKANTVMAAYDDAIHGVTGRAGDERIFDVDRNIDGYRELFASRESFEIDANDNPILCDRVVRAAEELGFADRVSAVNDSANPGADGVKDDAMSDADGVKADAETAIGGAAGGVCRITLCSSIFTGEALRLAESADFLIDQNECIAAADRLAAIQEDYVRSRELFIYTQLPLFMRQAVLLRKGEGYAVY